MSDNTKFVGKIVSIEPEGGETVPFETCEVGETETYVLCKECIGKRCRITTTWGSFSGKEGIVVAYDEKLDAFTVDLGDAFPLTFGVSVVQVIP